MSYYRPLPQPQPFNPYMFGMNSNGMGACGVQRPFGSNPPPGFGFPAPAPMNFGTAFGAQPLNPTFFSMPTSMDPPGSQFYPYSSAAIPELPVFMASSPSGAYSISSPTGVPGYFLHQCPQIPAASFVPPSPHVPTNELQQMASCIAHNGLHLGMLSPSYRQMNYCETPQMAKPYFNNQPLFYFDDHQPMQEFVEPNNNLHGSTQLYNDAGEAGDFQAEVNEGTEFRYEEAKLGSGEYVEYYEMDSENEAPEEEPVVTQDADDNPKQEDQTECGALGEDRPDGEQNEDGSSEAETDTSSSSLFAEHDVEETKSTGKVDGRASPANAAENGQWSAEVEAENERQTNFGITRDSPSKSLISSFQNAFISEKPQYQYGYASDPMIPPPGMLLNGFVGCPFTNPYFSSGNSGFSSQTTSAFASQSSSSTSLGSGTSFGSSLTSFGSIGSNFPVIYDNFIPQPQFPPLFVKGNALSEIGMSFYEQGMELPFVSSIFNENRCALLKANEQKYEYYVPPRVDDNDYFGGQIRIWAFKFNEYFSRFPNVWRLQALPELPVPLFESGLTRWFRDNMTTKLRFCCRHCKRPWTSMRGKIGFLFALDPQTGRGHAYVKIFAQVCNQDSCTSQGFQAPACYPEEVDKVIWKLAQFVGYLFYKIPFSKDLMKTTDKAIRDGHPKSQHMQDLCQACQQGVCSLGKAMG